MDTESIGIIDDSQDQTGEDPFLEGLQFKHCRYEVCLPWRNCELAIPDHFNLCLNRLCLLRTQLLKSPEFLDKYHTIIQEQLKKGVVEMVPEDPWDATAGNTLNSLSSTPWNALPGQADYQAEGSLQWIG